MALIMGVDPGSRKTGYGLVQKCGTKTRYIASGVIRMSAELTLPERLKEIFSAVSQIIDDPARGAARARGAGAGQLRLLEARHLLAEFLQLAPPPLP